MLSWCQSGHELSIWQTMAFVKKQSAQRYRE
jgi:hypothetical protein